MKQIDEPPFHVNAKSEMRVLMLTYSFNLGGSELQLVALASGLQKKGCLVTVAGVSTGGPLQRNLDLVGVSTVSLHRRGRWDVVGLFTHLFRLIRREKPDILHSYLVVPNIIAIFFKPLFPRLRIVWGIRASNAEIYVSDWLSHIYYWIERHLAHFADLIIINSYAGLKHFSHKSFPIEKMQIIPNGIDTERFQRDILKGKHIRDEWGIGTQDILIGLVGRLNPMKDHPTFFQAAAQLIKERSDIRIVCVGDGPAVYRNQLYALGRNLGLDHHLIWAGARDDMPAVYSALDMACSSSVTEGFPNAIGEAMACGVPCVVTDVGDSARIVGETGVVVPQGNPVALAEGLKRCLAEVKTGSDSQTRGRIIAHFRLDRLIWRTEEALLALVNDAGIPGAC